MRLEEIINRHRNELNDTDMAIWKYILQHRAEARHISIHELARACAVSSTTIVRFAQKLGFDGFGELKAEYCEDTGKQAYPDGYTFTPGTMVAEFEDTVKAQKEYEISDPVKTSYGYHVIMRLPLSGDSLLFSVQGNPTVARVTVAQNALTKELDDYYAAHPATFIDGLEDLDLTQYIEK